MWLHSSLLVALSHTSGDAPLLVLVSSFPLPQASYSFLLATLPQGPAARPRASVGLESGVGTMDRGLC